MSDDALERTAERTAERLGALTPAAPAGLRERVLFAAGRAAGRKPLAAWRAFAATGWLAALGVGIYAILARPESAVVAVPVVVIVERVTPPVPVSPEAGPVAADAPEPIDFGAAWDRASAAFRQRSQVMRYGLDRLPSTPPAGDAVPPPAAPWSVFGVHPGPRAFPEY